MSPTNRAAWLMTKGSPVLVVDSAPYTTPSTNEVVVKTKAVDLNPAVIIYLNSMMSLKDYPAILGCDVAGEVVKCTTLWLMTTALATMSLPRVAVRTEKMALTATLPLKNMWW
ncbi:uncharacterized protein A1O9_09836 [Exophiala aquamarina CBS 119918]|uniref:Alcohol dehydrogenase-like N-terminal domain-containing protein n=1 Tax=Exophiala aquamarina CBS 119918 TaxID=1182545 RepID=A0A072P2F1_9EURO|nr:uncharacterized protein A1O9_09836 [Exophiala aquamarina CBS 119918]KEF54041.1 hypothetical protein A1O9_09836 [Exophiala aquamarina CBS 119918]